MTEAEPTRPKVQYWDSCVFISLLTNLQPERVDVIKALLEQARAAKPRLRIVLSTLVLAEVRPAGADTKKSRRVLDELFDVAHPYMQFYAVTRGIALRAREIGTATKITVPDAIHIATAQEAGAEVFFTYDGDSKSKKNRRSGDLLRFDRRLGTPPLKIETPNIDFGPLFRNVASAAS